MLTQNDEVPASEMLNSKISFRYESKMLLVSGLEKNWMLKLKKNSFGYETEVKGLEKNWDWKLNFVMAFTPPHNIESCDLVVAL